MLDPETFWYTYIFFSFFFFFSSSREWVAVHCGVTLVRPYHGDGRRGRPGSRDIGCKPMVANRTVAVHKQTVKDKVAVRDVVLEVFEAGSGVDIIGQRNGYRQVSGARRRRRRTTSTSTTARRLTLPLRSGRLLREHRKHVVGDLPRLLVGGGLGRDPRPFARAGASAATRRVDALSASAFALGVFGIVFIFPVRQRGPGLWGGRKPGVKGGRSSAYSCTWF